MGGVSWGCGIFRCNFDFDVKSSKMLSFRRGDLKRLRKDELLDIAAATVGNVDMKKLRKCDIVDCIIRSQQENIEPESGDVSVQLTESEKVNFVEFSYHRFTDDDVLSVPDITFMHIYNFVTQDGFGESSSKALDRAVKHTSAGDISDVRYTKV